MKMLLIIVLALAALLPASAQTTAAQAALLVGPASAAAPAYPEYVGYGGGMSELGSNPTFSFTFANAVASGETIVVGIAMSANNGNIASVTDGANTYISTCGQQSGQGKTIAIWYATNAVARSTSDTLTVTVNSPSYSYRKVLSAVYRNVSSIDTCTAGTGSGSTVGAAATAAANTVTFGSVTGNSGYTYGAFTPITSVGAADCTFYISHTSRTTSGSQDIGGTAPLFAGWLAYWVSFK